jgi:hypothetical protein
MLVVSTGTPPRTKILYTSAHTPTLQFCGVEMTARKHPSIRTFDIAIQNEATG